MSKESSDIRGIHMTKWKGHSTVSQEVTPIHRASLSTANHRIEVLKQKCMSTAFGAG